MSNAMIIPADKLEAEAMEVGPQPAEALTNSDDWRQESSEAAGVHQQ